MVNLGLRQLWGKGRGEERLRSAIVVILTATIVALPTSGLPSSTSIGASQMPSSRTGPSVESDEYDPAAAHFFSLLSFGAMSLITPTVFGDFQSPVLVSEAPPLNGIMKQGAGFDPAVSTMLDGIVQQDILPSAGALTVAEFSVGSNSDTASGGNAASAGNADFGGDNVPTVTADMKGPHELSSLNPVCGEAPVADNLETGGEFWNNSGTGLGAARSAPAEVPRGVFAGPVILASPLHGLDPNSKRSNLVSAGLAGGWCLSGRESSLLDSSIEDDLLLIALSIVLCALLVMWMS